MEPFWKRPGAGPRSDGSIYKQMGTISGTNSKRVLENCLRMFSVYVLFMRAVSRVPVRTFGLTVPETLSCDGYVIHMQTQPCVLIRFPVF